MLRCPCSSDENLPSRAFGSSYRRGERVGHLFGDPALDGNIMRTAGKT